jgi:hypothetical protein
MASLLGLGLFCNGGLGGGLDPAPAQPKQAHERSYGLLLCRCRTKEPRPPALPPWHEFKSFDGSLQKVLVPVQACMHQSFLQARTHADQEPVL